MTTNGSITSKGLESRCETVRDGVAFLDSACTIIHEGREFTNQGAWIMKRADTGEYEGAVYASEPILKRHGSVGTVGNWDGSIKIPACFGYSYYSNFGDRRRHIWFRWEGRNFHGVLCSADWNQLVRVKEVA